VIEAIVRSFGLDALAPLALGEGSGMFRPEVVLSWKAGSIHIFGELSRISGRVLCPEWHVGIRPFGGRAPVGAVHERQRLIFGRKATSHGPVGGLSS
jgi:hypothetical protein